MSGSGALYLPARAKLNLVLRVVGRRADGYHLLETLFHALALHDDVVVRRRDEPGVGITVGADRPELRVAASPDNLAAQALLRLQQATGSARGLHVHVHKRIPHGGGLGGGSSDAAAALRLGNRLLGEPLDGGALAALGVGLGADVPFFLRGGSQWGRGVGDQLAPAAGVPARAFALVLPRFGCDTAAVYKIHARRWQGREGADSLRPITVPENRKTAADNGFENQLEAAAEQLRPELGRLRAAVAAAGFPGVRMTGSGSTLFVARADRDAAEACRERLLRAFAGTEHDGVSVVTTVSGPAIDGDEPSPDLPPGLRGGAPGT